MAISRLLIQNFRNIPTADLTLNPNFNFLIGNNGSGKTSFLEAIFYLGHGRSFKNSMVSRIIEHDAAHFTLFGKICEQQKEWEIGLQKFRQGDGIFKINGQTASKMSDLAKLLPIQIISPEGLSLLTGGPSYRRSFLDWGLFHHQKNFYPTWKDLRRLLKQRNAALAIVKNYAALKIWDQQLAKMAQQISQWRIEYAQSLESSIAANCHLFMPKIEITTRFYQGWDKNIDYAELLEQNFERDKSTGYTVAGPQKAELRIKAHGQIASDFLSRGQLKLLVIALKLAQGEYLMQHQHRQCIFLIDDFSSELDAHNCILLSQRLSEINSQVFITAIKQQQIAEMHTSSHHLFQLENGNIKMS